MRTKSEHEAGGGCAPLTGSAPDGWRWYLVEYEYNGSKWSLDILATDDDDASARVEALFNAKLLGERMMTIPAFAGAGILTRGLCALRNFLWKP